MATRTTPSISINGGPDVDGAIIEESSGGLRDWRGEVQAAYMTCETIKVMAFLPGHVLLGEAIVTACEFNSDGTMVSRFAGNGRLARWDYATLATILERFEDEAK